MVLSENFKGSSHLSIRQVKIGLTKEDSNFKQDNRLLVLSKISGTHGDQSKTCRAYKCDVSYIRNMNVGIPLVS